MLRKRVSLLLLGGLLQLLIPAWPVQGDNQPLSFNISSGEPLKSAYALLVMPSAAEPGKTSVEQRPVELIQVDGALWQARLVYPGGLPAGAVVTVVASSSSGRTIAGDVVMLEAPAKSISPGNVRCGPDEQYQSMESLIALNEPQLREAISARRRQRDTLRHAAASALSNQTAAEVMRLEGENGLKNSRPPRPDDPPADLAARFAALRALMGR